MSFKGKALVMKPIDTQMNQAPNWEFTTKLSKKETPFNKYSVKGSQFNMPYLEFSEHVLDAESPLHEAHHSVVRRQDDDS
jgi:hypothetical protein